MNCVRSRGDVRSIRRRHCIVQESRFRKSTVVWYVYRARRGGRGANGICPFLYCSLSKNYRMHRISFVLLAFASRVFDDVIARVPTRVLSHSKGTSPVLWASRFYAGEITLVD